MIDGANNRVGIGTTSPSYKLDVSGSARVVNELWLDSTGQSSLVWTLNGTNKYNIAYNPNGYLQFYNYVAGNIAMAIANGSSNVGIGTTNPNAILHIEQSVNGNMPIRFRNRYGASSNTASTVDILSELVASDQAGQIGSMIRTGKEGDYSVNGTRDAYMSFSTAENDVLNERMRISSAGGVAIGVSNASNYMLYVSGSTAHGIRSTSQTTNYWASVHTHTAGTEVDLAGSSYAAVFTGGYVGIGTISPGTNLEVYRLETSARTTITDLVTINASANNNPYSGHGAAVLFKGNTYNGGLRNWGRIGMYLTDSSLGTTGENMYFAVAPASNSDTINTAMTIQHNGNVGINTTVPLSKLEVAGNLKTTDGYPNHQTVIVSVGAQGSFSGALTITIPDMESAAGSYGYGGYSCEVYISGYSGMYCHAFFSGYVNSGIVAGEATIIRSSSGWSVSQSINGYQGQTFVIDYPGGLTHPTARIVWNKGGHNAANGTDANNITAVWS
jgi:hypothetical protein